MVPISARLPDDLYAWLSMFPMEDATTVSDKLRVAVTHLKRMHDGNSDYIGALSMYRDMTQGTRASISALERDTGHHSEVLSALMEHLPVLTAMLSAAQVGTVDDARKLESALVKRTLQLAETLLRQAITSDAAAYDPQVVSKNSRSVIELARLIPSSI